MKGFWNFCALIVATQEYVQDVVLMGILNLTKQVNSKVAGQSGQSGGAPRGKCMWEGSGGEQTYSIIFP